MLQEQPYYTKEAIEKLKQELQELKFKKRREVAERIREAKSFGDLSENAEYTDAKEAQAFVEGRIQEIEYILENAKVVEDDQCAGRGIVQVNCKVVVSDSKGQEKEYTIVSTDKVNSLENKISPSSPIGKALLGKKVGDKIEVEIPSGKLDLEIKRIS